MKTLKEKKLLVRMQQRIGEPVDQKLLDEIAEEEAKIQQVAESRRNAFQSMFAGLSNDIGKLMADEKKKTAEEQAILDRFASTLSKIDEIKAAQSISEQPQVTIPEEVADGQLEKVLDEIVEEVELTEKSAILAPIEEPTLAKEAAKKISKEAPPSVFVQPEPAATGRDLADIQRKLKLLEGWVSKISMTGPGGGAVWLKDLDDVARSSVIGAADGDVLTYNASTKKWIANPITITANGIVGTLDQVTTAGNSTNNDIVVGDVLPHTNLMYSLGSDTQRWESLWVGANSITFSDTLGGPDQVLSLANQVFYITQGGGSNTTFNANAGFNAGGIILQNYTMQLANTTQDLVIGSASVDTSVIINQNLLVNTTITFSDNTTQNTAATQADWTEANTSKLSFIKNKPTIPTTIDSLTDVTITGPLNNQVLTYNTSLGQWINQNGTSNNFTTGYFGAFYYNGANVALSNTTNAYIVPITASYDGTNGVTVGSNNDIVFAHSGTYRIEYSIQYENTGNADDDANVWVRINGTDQTNTNSRFSVNRKNTGQDPGSLIAVTPFMMTVNAGDRVQVMHSSEGGHVKLVSYAAGTTPTVPSTPAVIINVEQVSGIVIPDNISGTANNATNLGGFSANQYAYANSLSVYQTTAGLSANVATLSSNNTSYLGTKAANQYAYANGSNFSINNSLTVTYTPATANGAALTATGKDTQGGIGYFDFLKVTNTTSGVTNGNKTFRLSSAGAVEIINSAYTAPLVILSDAGNMSISGDYQVNGKKAVNGPAFSAYPTSPAQTIASGSNTRVNLGNEEYDIGGCYDAPNGKFQPNVEGYYQLNATVRIDGSSGTGERMIVIYKNGAEHKRGTNEMGTEAGANFFTLSVSCIAYANGSGDYFQVYVYQSSGANRTISEYQQISYFQGCMIRGA